MSKSKKRDLWRGIAPPDLPSPFRTLPTNPLHCRTSAQDSGMQKAGFSKQKTALLCELRGQHQPKPVKVEVVVRVEAIPRPAAHICAALIICPATPGNIIITR